jgi:SAM-dependent methyltransferase
MLEQFDAYLGKDILEPGCGAGNLTQHLLSGERHVTAVDIDEIHLRNVEDMLGGSGALELVKGDLNSKATYSSLGRIFDTVVCINVLEHLVDPEQAMEGFKMVTRPGGHILILVPAHQWLYSAADRALHHTMRYSRGGLRATIERSGVELIELRQFNRLGVVGWLVNKVIGRTHISSRQAQTFGWLLPVARALEMLRFLPGLSWIAVARAPQIVLSD